MLSDLREYLKYLEFRKDYPKLDKGEVRKLMYEKALNEKEMPLCFRDIDKTNLYRLIYVTYIDKSFYLTMKSQIYSRPLGISQEDVFKVISYIRDCLEIRGILTPKEIKVIEYIMKDKYGFTMVDKVNNQTIVDLYFCSGDLSSFIKSKLYENYFSWYIPNVVSEVDIYNIYEGVTPNVTLKLK